MRIVKATEQEQAAYLAQSPKPVYPLYGFITIDSHRCAIEDLRGSWTSPDPLYEIIAPSGLHFSLAGPLHTMLCHNLADVRERAHSEGALGVCHCYDRDGDATAAGVTK